MGRHAIVHTDDVAYLCSTCHTFIAVCNDLKNIGISSRLGNCFHFTKCYNILEHDSGRVQVLKYGQVQHIEPNPTDEYDLKDSKELVCKLCNNFVGWKLKENKFVLIKKRLI